MPDIAITKCVDSEGNDLEGAVVIAISQADLFNNIVHTEEGSDWPTMSFAKANLTNEYGRCVIAVSGSQYATVAFVYNDDTVLSDMRPHIDLAQT